MSGEEDETAVVSKRELAEKGELIKSLDEQCQKLKSDFARYKKRVEDREAAIRGDERSELSKRLLSVADSLDRALDSYNGNDSGSGCEVVEELLDGTRSNLEMTYNQLLTGLGVTPIIPSPGERLNDELHTAIETTPNTLLPDKTIVSLVRRGYTLNGRLIRPAEVVISKGGEAGEEKVKAESKHESILSKILRGFESRLFRRKFEELEIKEQELSQNEEMLRWSVKELNAREDEFKKRVEEGVKRREAEESRVRELEQSKEALNKYKEELLEEKEKLLSEIEEMEKAKESLNAELKEMEETKEKVLVLQPGDLGMCQY